MNGRAVTERLLATTSLAALMLAALSSEAAAQACAGGETDNFGILSSHQITTSQGRFVNEDTGVIGGNNLVPTSGALAVTGSGTLTCGITNSGTITGRTGGGLSIGIGVAGLIQGGITNSGTVSGGDRAIQITNAATSFGGGITNSGALTSGNTAVLISAQTFNGSVINSSTGTLTAGGADAQASILVTGVSLFTGNISNAGTITTAGFAQGIIIDGNGTFAGGFTNAGSIAGPEEAINILNTASFGGGIVNALGATMISASDAAIEIGTDGAVSLFSGGITNAGTITAHLFGIEISGVSTFSGGISNSGAMLVGNGGAIVVGTVGNFAQGITNSGTIFASARGIDAFGISTFSGGISNAAGATISSTHSDAIAARFMENFSGGISNSGLLSANKTGIDIDNTATFAGSVTNSGTISAGLEGIRIATVGTFADGITNAGTITGLHAVDIDTVGIFTGGITNSGLVTGNVGAAIRILDVASFAGNIVNSAGATIVSAQNDGIGIFNVAGFSGNISNNGTIMGTRGIVVGTAGPSNGVSFTGAIVNTGTIQGTGGTAIDLSFALGPVTVQQAGGTLLGTILFSSHGDTLSGFGTVVGNITQGNATIAPGLGGNNMLKIAGNLTQGASSTTVIEVSPAAAAQLNVTGTASIAGALKLVYDPGTYSNKTYDIVHAGTALAGTYATTTSINLPANATQSLTYTSNDLNLALSSLSISTTTGAFGDAANIALSGAFDSDNIVFDHLDETQFGQGADQVKTAVAGAAPIQVAMNGPLQQLAQASSRMSDSLARYGGWVRGVGSFFSADNQGSASGFSASGGGVLAGIDHPFGPVTVGVAGGYSGTNFTQNDGETGDIQTIRAMLYAHYRAAPQIVVDGIAGFAYDRIHTSRPIASLGTSATESHNGFEENLAIQAGYVMPWQGFTLIPRVGAQYLHLSENRFSESGGSGFNLTSGPQNVDSFQPTIGVTALKPILLDNGMRVTPAFKLAYSHELLNPNTTLALTTPTAVSVPASIVTPAHNVVTLGPSATLRMNDSLNLYADYKLSIGIGKSLDHVIFAGARFAW
jgi:outer membrane autotransporter protein